MIKKASLGSSVGLAPTGETPGAALAREWALPKSKAAGKTLIRNVDVLTMQEDHSEIRGIDVLLAEGRIAAIANAIPQADADVIDGSGRILMPGFIDGVRCNWMSLDTGRFLKMNQGAREIYGGYIPNLAKAMTAEECYLSDYLGGVEALNSGYTAMVNYGRWGPFEQVEPACAGVKASGIGGLYCHAVTDPASVILPGEAEFEVAERIRDTHFHEGGDMQFGLAMPLNWGPTYAEFRSFYERARRLHPKLLLMFHHNQGGTGPRPQAMPRLSPDTVRSVADLRDCGVLGPDMQLVHGNALTDEELKFLAAAGVTFSSAVLSEFTYPEDITSIYARAHAAGASASIGFDVPLGQSRDPFEMVRAAFVSLFKTPESRKLAEMQRSDDALVWLTREAARCARMGDQAGTVTVGKRADVILLNTDRIGFPAIGTLADRVASFALLSDIDSVWVAGMPRKRDGKMVGIDMAALKAKVVAHQHRVWESLGSPVFGIRG
jgi:cytosine/adenosine deaminase-related metal-dependent hydrolase